MRFVSPRLYLVLSIIALLPALVFGQDDSSPSLGDVARKLRKDVSDDVRMTDADTKKLFNSVDEIFTFASEDSGMPKHASVQRRMVSKADVEAYARGHLAKEEYTQHFAQAELTMKKLGFLPREFDLKEFLVKSTGKEIAGYYDDETKTISLLNWVPADRQEPILAHELTHALQDQNYDLAKWMKEASTGGKDDENADSAIARKAVVEGQAMVVYVDYVLKPFGRNMIDTPGLIYQMEEPAVKAVQDSQIMHDAPMILREAGSFAYNEGLIFEGELLQKGGRKMAFQGAFARPPRNSHEVLQPEAYINAEKLPATLVPDLKQLIGEEYEVFDSGGIGQLDVRAYLKQYGERRNADEVSSAWQGGAYAAYRRKKAGTEATPTTSDLATIYVSRWKTSQAAARFARFYASTVAKRYQTVTAQTPTACSAQKCPLAVAQYVTEEGPVVVEQWADNSVVVSESFDMNTALKIQDAVQETDASAHASSVPEEEIGLRLYEFPAFQRFAEQIGAEIALGMQGR
ncbi:MAG TPA: hypothetical protein VGS27_30190 [Candidatus Sulfotelmatobacter sp.]|nr:hypothetical protein [Candidatus Sulfotelmatobacter sp.]